MKKNYLVAKGNLRQKIYILPEPEPEPENDIDKAYSADVSTMSHLDQMGGLSPEGLIEEQQYLLHHHIKGDVSISELMLILKRSNRTKLRIQILTPLVEKRLVVMTIPDKPTSSKQKYRLSRSNDSNHHENVIDKD